MVDALSAIWSKSFLVSATEARDMLLQGSWVLSQFLGYPISSKQRLLECPSRPQCGHFPWGWSQLGWLGRVYPSQFCNPPRFDPEDDPRAFAAMAVGSLLSTSIFIASFRSASRRTYA
jgi:hypothetical protein